MAGLACRSRLTGKRSQRCRWLAVQGLHKAANALVSRHRGGCTRTLGREGALDQKSAQNANAEIRCTQ